MRGIDKRRYFSSQRLDLFVIQDADASEVPVFSVKTNLRFAQPVRLPVLTRNWFWKQIAHRTMIA
jgi:hypothetical protein